ncbi:hypothetical protein AVEN_201233-1 [Araneus ventricosus]|uniref:Uncharacterized protein n=1 Tax=Araneus ventricosus TaxID=182803 RepID=A0A4Y2HJ71_ARAVE|nr:hypothetical protein AVEN_201233-1 [Araneus ventricosus]
MRVPGSKSNSTEDPTGPFLRVWGLLHTKSYVEAKRPPVGVVQKVESSLQTLPNAWIIDSGKLKLLPAQARMKSTSLNREVYKKTFPRPIIYHTKRRENCQYRYRKIKVTPCSSKDENHISYQRSL